jgi:alkylation response protein AidB-like acyl-CoA dehydrogenase
MILLPVQFENYPPDPDGGNVLGMTTTDVAPSAETPAQIPPITDQQVVDLAAAVGRVAAPHDAEHDRDATFVTEAYTAMAELGYLRLAGPPELGGLGADIRQVVLAQEELASWSGASGLAATMHLYLTLVQRFRLRRGFADAAGALRKVADDGLVMATSGGSDWVRPTTVATEVEGGFRFDGRKGFCTQAPVAGVLSTSAVLGEPGPDAIVLHAGVPLSAPGVRIEETWDTLGMRGTASHDLVFDGVFVPADKVIGRRPYGALAGPLLVAAIHFAPLAAAAYLGVARGACAEATRLAAGRDRASTTRLVGEMHARLRVAKWALLAAVDEVGDDPAPDEAVLAAWMTAKRHAVLEARAVVDLALEVAGGRAFYRSCPLERAYRDVRGGPFHPLTPEDTLELVGGRALSP